ncbi:MAG: hypothetical protein QGG50_03960 [Methanopyri archaeon]|nr:hypothetical protein [Methanopyri archaeon]
MVPIDEYELLKRMHNYGVVSRHNAKTVHELVDMMTIDEGDMKELLERLIEYSYVHAVTSDDVARYYVTGPGIITVCSFFT